MAHPETMIPQPAELWAAVVVLEETRKPGPEDEATRSIEEWYLARVVAWSPASGDSDHLQPWVLLVSQEVGQFGPFLIQSPNGWSEKEHGNSGDAWAPDRWTRRTAHQIRYAQTRHEALLAAERMVQRQPESTRFRAECLGDLRRTEAA